MEYETITCSVCDASDRLSFSGETGERMRRETLCFECAFWKEKIEWVAEHPEVSVRVKCRHYVISPDRSAHEPRYLAGFGGSGFVIIFHDGRRVETHNLWNGGVIPDRFRDQLPDNAVFE